MSVLDSLGHAEREQMMRMIYRVPRTVYVDYWLPSQVTAWPYVTSAIYIHC